MTDWNYNNMEKPNRYYGSDATLRQLLGFWNQKLDTEYPPANRTRNPLDVGYGPKFIEDSFVVNPAHGT